MAQRTYPKIYLLNEYASIQNASDGRVNDGGPVIAPCSVTWDADAFTRVARHIEADTGARMAELGLDPAAYGIRF
ncbi:hypothetical protein [Paraburkholderia sp. GAS32]|uniref:hypothetical protein n=1 Tax=Paraburkholderia sp. GAS32 TaxID=3035129 RepID=UPI003D19DFDD